MKSRKRTQKGDFMWKIFERLQTINFSIDRHHLTIFVLFPADVDGELRILTPCSDIKRTPLRDVTVAKPRKRNQNTSSNQLLPQNSLKNDVVTKPFDIVVSKPLNSPKMNFDVEPITANIMKLNDDNLRKIFSYLNLKDLWSMANACQRFAYIVTTRFSLTSVNFETLDFDNIFELENFLLIFGSHIVSLNVTLPNIFKSIDPFQYEYAIQELIVRNCSIDLVELKLSYFKIVAVEMWQPIFAKLRKLHLHRCRFTDEFLQMLACCVKLEQFEWNTSTLDIAWQLRFNFPKLEIFRINEVWGMETQTMKKFLKENPQIRELSITNCDNIEDSFIEDISIQLPSIRNFSFRRSIRAEKWYSFYRHLLRVNTLKTLRLNCNHKRDITSHISRTLHSFKLEHLVIACHVADNHLLRGIAKMKTLKSLELLAIDGLKINRVLKIVKNLENLSKLHVVDCIGLNMSALVDIVRAAKKLEYLQFYSSTTQVKITASTYKHLVGIVKKRANNIPLRILAVANENMQEEWATNKETLIIRYVRYFDLCKLCLPDDFFLFDFYYDYELRSSGNHQRSECSINNN